MRQLPFRLTGFADPLLEREFLRVYQEPSLRYLQVAFVFGFVSFAGFFVMDLVNHTSMAVAAVPAVRGVVVLAFAAALAATCWRRELVMRHYILVLSFFSVLGMLGAALLPIAVHGHRSPADIFWSVNSSLTTGVIVIYGFSRLTALRTASIVLSGCVLGISTVFLIPVFDGYSLGRLCLHVAIVNVCAFSLRETIERRERELFLLARENLSKNVYAQELEVARARAEEGNEVKLRFLANMSHEFRTPMHGMLQTLEIVSRAASREATTLIDKARASGQSLVSLLDGILEYTGLTERGLRPKPALLSLAASVRGAVGRHRGEAEARGLAVSLRLDLADAEDSVMLDPQMWGEVVSRLLENAIRFTDQGNVRVEVVLKRRETAVYPAADVELQIVDTGIGISAPLHELVFTPFYQVDGASTRKVGGSGLGLAIVRRLVDLMGGTIALDSTVGRGTTVRVRLPVEICRARSPRARADRRGAAAAPLERATLHGTVLLAEDNELNAALVVELLGLMGLEVVHAADGDEAHAQAAGRRFDAILMDCQMPNVDGYEATRRLRDDEKRIGRARVPIIALTANALAGDREKCLGAGMDDYLAKPYTAAQLHAALSAWLPQALPLAPVAPAVPSQAETQRS